MTLTRVNSNSITDGSIVDADVNASAAIAGTKVSPDFGSQNVATTGTVSGASLTPTSSSVPTNGVYLPGANALGLATASTERVRVTSGGLVGIGTTTVDERLHIVGNFKGVDSSGRGVQIINGATPYIQSLGTSNINDLQVLAQTIQFGTGTTYSTSERARIDSSGRLLVGTSTARTNFNNSTDDPQLQIESANGFGWASIRNSNSSGGANVYIAKSRGTGNVVLQNNDVIGALSYQGNDGSEFVAAAQIAAEVDGTPGANDMPGRLVFSTTKDGQSSPTEAMRITSGQDLLIGATGITSVGGISLRANIGGAGTYPRLTLNTNQTSDSVVFEYNSAVVGKIQIQSSATAYITSSDYRLKENVKPVSDGIARLQQLKPSRFNFIADPDTTVDGFLAHEVQDIVPEAIAGEKDAVDDEGNPIYQGIDQSKLVPLLTAALQEAIAKIESLEARLTAAGI